MERSGVLIDCVQGMVLLGLVQAVEEFQVRVSLPGHLQGCVPITNISPAYTAFLRQVLFFLFLCFQVDFS